MNGIYTATTDRSVPELCPSDNIKPCPSSTITETKECRQVSDTSTCQPCNKPLGSSGPPGEWLSHRMSTSHELAFNCMICMVQFIPQACLTTCFPIIRIIVSDFSIKDPSLVPWVVAAYALPFGTTILLAGRLGDIFGHKKMVVLGFCWLSVFSVLAGLSHYVGHRFFFLARAFQGIGAAMMNPNALALLGRSYSPGSKRKIIAFSAFALCAPLGAYTGMLASALLGQFGHWYWSFYTTAIVSILLALASQFILPSPSRTSKKVLSIRKKVAEMDWLGGLAGVSGLVAIQVSLICAPSQHWSTPYIFTLFIAGILLIIVFIFVELKFASEPLVPFHLLNSNTVFVLAITASGWGTFGTWTFYLWRFFLSTLHLQPTLAALYAVPIVPVAIIAAILTARLLRTISPAWILFWALTAFTLGPLFLAFNTPTTSYWTFTFISLLITPFGMDMSFPAATFLMSNSLPLEKQGIAGSLVTTVVNYSISLGLGLATTVEASLVARGGLRRDSLEAIKAGWWFGVGLGGLGMLFSVVFIVKSSGRCRSKTGPVGGQVGGQVVALTTGGGAETVSAHLSRDRNQEESESEKSINNNTFEHASVDLTKNLDV